LGARGSQRWWDRPLLPYLLLSASPMLTLPIGRIILTSLPDCGIDEPWWELGHFELALLPALADFLPFLWLVSGTPKVRRAALFAGLMGAARFAIPQAVTLDYGLSTIAQPGNSACTISSPFVAALVAPIILALWLVSALVAALILFRARTEVQH
jgi:hypothetical protein